MDNRGYLYCCAKEKALAKKGLTSMERDLDSIAMLTEPVDKL